MRIFACMASSLDGKIGPASTRHFAAITSRYDMEHLKSLRDEADGILFGASTFRAWPKVHLGHNRSKSPHHFIMSHSLDLDPNTPLFQALEIPITIFSDSTPVTSRQTFPKHVELVHIPEGPDQIIFIMNYLKERGINSLLIEGGGQILHHFIEAGFLQELYLTLAPVLIGQLSAPGLLGDQTLTRPPEFSLLSSQQIENELYLHFKLNYSAIGFNTKFDGFAKSI